jgi:hypothetical protein
MAMVQKLGVSFDDTSRELNPNHDQLQTKGI